jgi:hypothetical protein
VLDNTQALVAIAAGLVMLAGSAWTFRAKVKPWWDGLRRDYVAGRDALVGREAVRDSITGRELSPALPGIGQRMANVETAIVAIAQQQEDIADLKHAVAVHDREIGRHGEDISELKAAVVERVVNKVEQTELWRTVGLIHDRDDPPGLPSEFTD